jgi:hypothetical protein
MKQQTKPQKSHLDEIARKVRKYDNKAVIERLKGYGIGEKDFVVEKNVYHSEDRRGVPYLALLVNKALSKEDEAELALAISRIDSTLCVIFKKRGE